MNPEGKLFFENQK